MTAPAGRFLFPIRPRCRGAMPRASPAVEHRLIRPALPGRSAVTSGERSAGDRFQSAPRATERCGLSKPEVTCVQIRPRCRNDADTTLNYAVSPVSIRPLPPTMRKTAGVELFNPRPRCHRAMPTAKQPSRRRTIHRPLPQGDARNPHANTSRFNPRHCQNDAPNARITMRSCSITPQLPQGDAHHARRRWERFQSAAKTGRCDVEA